jgi:hypothetical protein
MPRFAPCPTCGVSLDRGSPVAHVCDTERLLDECMAALRGELDLLEPQWRQWLASPEGRRDRWSAVRQVRKTGGPGAAGG